MSGRAKHLVWFLLYAVLFLCAFAGAVAIAYFYGFQPWENRFCFIVFCGITLLAPFELLVHELGHLFFGLLLGFRPISFSVYGILFGHVSAKSRYNSRAGGKTVVLPRGTKNLRARLVFLSFGGSLFNLIYGGVLLACWFLLPHSPALFFFTLFAPLNLCEGIVELLPFELTTGRTDGKMMIELCRNSSYARVFTTVLAAQGKLMKSSYAELPKELLFETPVIREDDPAAIALQQLRWQYSYFIGDDDGAKSCISRLEDLYADGIAPTEIVCDLVWWKRVVQGESVEEIFEGNTVPELRVKYALSGKGKGELRDAIAREKFVGIRLFEEKLLAKTEEAIEKE